MSDHRQHLSTLLVIALTVGSLAVAGLSVTFCLNIYWIRQDKRNSNNPSSTAPGDVELGRVRAFPHTTAVRLPRHTRAPDTRWQALARYFAY